MKTTRCSVGGCERDSRARGLCKMHHKRLRRRGVLALLPARVKATRCNIEGCEQGGRIILGVCAMHYNRLRVYGRLGRLPVRSPAERLAARLERDYRGCLVWGGATGACGYGVINVAGRMVGTHRLAWQLANGPIPAGMDVCHHCDNPPCCDPAHLFLGTRKQNMADMVTKGRQGRNGNEKKTHCVKGHSFTPENTFVNLKGSRVCLTCKRAADVRRRAKRSVSIVEAA